MRSKKIHRKHKKVRNFFKKGSTQYSYVFIIAVALLFAAVLGGGSRVPFDPNAYPQSPNTTIGGGVACCDTGSGEQCKPSTTQTISAWGVKYGLLKSKFRPTEKGEHLIPRTTSEGIEIFQNDRKDNDTKPGCPADADWLVKRHPDGQAECVPISNDVLIYVCNTASPPGSCHAENKQTSGALFDAYFRLSDYRPDNPTNNGIPDAIKNCAIPASSGSNVTPGSQVIITQTANGAQNNLQLRTFTVGQSSGTMAEAEWISPWCKPAIYLYPEYTMPIHVEVFPIGPMTLTIPKYPAGGWNVVADIAGNITFANKSYEYLYWEAQIPDEKITIPNEGYVVTYQALEKFLPGLLGRLGLNARERSQFIEYWTSVLPESPYYKIAVIPQMQLNILAPLSITPAPQSVIRVTLHFTPLDQFVSIPEPTIAPVVRYGFTVVEWGGLFKRDAAHPFSCFM